MKEITLLQIYFHIMKDVKKDLPFVSAINRLVFAIQMVQEQDALIL